MVRKRFFFPLISALLLVVPEISYAGWTRTYGADQDDVSYCVRQTADCGFIIAGYSESQGGAWLLRTNQTGDTLWTSSPFGFMGGAAYSVQQTSDGSYILTGYMAATEDGKYHVGLVKIDSLGEEIWWHSDMDWFYDFDSTGGVGLSVQQTSDGGYILTGYRQPLIWEEITDLWLIKTDSAGDFQWSRTYGAENPDCGCCVRQTSDGGYIITGYTSPWFDEIEDLWLIKTDSDGDTLWTRIYGGEAEDLANCVDQTSDGGYIITGATKSFGAGGYDLWLLKTDSLGDTLSGIEESVIDLASNWHILSSVGREIVLRYEDCSHGFHAQVFDVMGQKVDEVHSSGSSGTVTWPAAHQSPGVYFIKQAGQTEPLAKVVLIR